MMDVKRIFFGISSLFVPLLSLAGVGFQPGNILISSQNMLYEYSTEGALISQIPIPDSSSNEIARDITILDDGRLAVFNGTFDPELSIFDGASWQSKKFDGWSIPNNVSYGGISSYDNMVFVTDGYTYNGGEAKGIIAVDLLNDDSLRFVDTDEYIDITLGNDGLLYGLQNMYGDLDIYDPETFTLVRSIDLGHTSGSRGVVAGADGSIYMASWNGYIAQYTPNGELLNTLNIGVSLLDIDIDENGRIVVGGRFGNAYLTDESLSTFTQLTSASSTNTFVSFVPSEQLPEAPTLRGKSIRNWYWVVTTLSWNTEAEAVDIYLNGKLIDTVIDSKSLVYKLRRYNNKVFVVCNANTNDCSNEYRVKLRRE